MLGVVKRTAKRLPVVSGVLGSRLYKRLRHRISLRTHRRVNSTFTGFYRLPTQFEALVGPVVDHVVGEVDGRALRIVVAGCSNGAEPYTIASVLSHARPDVAFQVLAFDIDPEILAKASRAVYEGDAEVYNNRVISEDFVERTFLRAGGEFRVKEELVRHVEFRHGDALDPGLGDQMGSADILFAQNFLFHLDPVTSKRALLNLCRLLAPRSALFADGTDLPIREQVTARLGLLPLDFELEAIHNEAMRARGVGWPDTYWGLEPFMTTSRNWVRRYATIFLRDEGGGGPDRGQRLT